MAKNKFVFGDEILLDLSTDTVSDPSHIMAGYIGHLRDGTQVVGTGQGGGIQTENIVSEQSINCNITVGNAYGGFITSYSAFPQNGEYYLVTLDGVDYVARAFYLSENALLVGDIRIQQSNQYVEFPFEILHEGTYFYLAVKASGAHTLKVDKILSF